MDNKTVKFGAECDFFDDKPLSVIAKSGAQVKIFMPCNSKHEQNDCQSGTENPTANAGDENVIEAIRRNGLQLPVIDKTVDIAVPTSTSQLINDSQFLTPDSTLNAEKVSGVLPVTTIPPAALERLTLVENDTARFALTPEQVQAGDTVKVTSTGKLYFIVDEANLDNAEGYEEYTAGTASAVDWSGILNKPTNLTGYGVKDEVLDLLEPMDTQLEEHESNLENHEDRIENLEIGQALYPLMTKAIMNIYVSSTTGSDTTGDGTQAKPYKTIDFALGKLPIIVQHTCNIYLMNQGTYATSGIIPKFNGGGSVIINGDINNKSSYIISGGLLFNAIGITFVIQGVTIQGTAPAHFDISSGNGTVSLVSACRRILFESCALKGSTGHGIFVHEASATEVRNCQISEYANNPILVQRASRCHVAYTAATAKSGANVIAEATSGSTLCVYGGNMQLSGNTTAWATKIQ